MRIALLAAALWLLPGAVAAQDINPPDIPPGEDHIEAMTSGERAPFTGMLLETDTAIRWTNRLRWWRETFQLRLREQGEILDALRRSHTVEIEVIRQSYEREIIGLREDFRQMVDLYERQLERYRNPPFYETWGFAFGTGVVAVSVVVGVVAGLVAGI
jgi:hypothetical protein